MQPSTAIVGPEQQGPQGTTRSTRQRLAALATLVLITLTGVVVRARVEGAGQTSAVVNNLDLGQLELLGFVEGAVRAALTLLSLM